MALITSAVRNKIDALIKDLGYLTFNIKYKHNTGESAEDDDMIVTEEDAKAVVERITKAIDALDKVSNKVTTKFNLR